MHPASPVECLPSMHDPRFDKLAKVLVEYSTRLKRNETVLIETFDVPDEMTVALVRAARKAGAIPFVQIQHARHDNGTAPLPFARRGRRHAGFRCWESLLAASRLAVARGWGPAVPRVPQCQRAVAAVRRLQHRFEHNRGPADDLGVIRAEVDGPQHLRSGPSQSPAD